MSETADTTVEIGRFSPSTLRAHAIHVRIKGSFVGRTLFQYRYSKSDVVVAVFFL